MRNTSEAYVRALGNLNNKDYAARIQAITLLSKYRHRHDVVEAVIPLLDDSHLEVRKMVAKILLRSFDRSAVQPLIKAARDCEPTIRSNVTRWVWLWKDARLDKIPVNALKDTDERVRISALMSLGFRGRPIDEKMILRALEDKEAMVRYQAAYTLIRVSPKIAQKHLINMFGDQDALCRLAAASLVDTSVKEASSMLFKAMEDNDPEVRQRSALTLGKHGVNKALRLLRNAFERDQHNFHSLLALLKIDYKPAMIFVLANYDRFDADSRSAIVYTLDGWDHKTAKDILELALEDSDTTVWLNAAKNLAAMGSEKAFKKLLDGLKIRNQYDFRDAIRYIGELGNKNAVPHLITALKRRRCFFRRDIIELLGVMKDQVAVKPLIKALRYGQPEIREHAARALVALGDSRACEHLIEALNDEYGSVRSAAAWAIGEFHVRKGAKPLIEVLGSDFNIFARRNAAEALGALRDQCAIEPLKKALRDEDPCLVRLANEALKKFEEQNLN